MKIVYMLYFYDIIVPMYFLLSLKAFSFSPLPVVYLCQIVHLKGQANIFTSVCITEGYFGRRSKTCNHIHIDVGIFYPECSSVFKSLTSLLCFVCFFAHFSLTEKEERVFNHILATTSKKVWLFIIHEHVKHVQKLSKSFI